jgi:short-subunit dehydrogenase
MDLDLRDNVVLVTGGSDGLGLALCEALVAEGAAVALCGRNEERLARAETKLLAAGGQVMARRCDVTDLVQLEAMVAAVHDRFGRLDGLVNNAGQAAGSPVVDVTEEGWERDLDLKLMAAVRLARLCCPMLAASPGGSIVNVLAIAGKAPGASSAPTSISRAAGLAFTKALSRDVASSGIRANAILIGLVESGQWARLSEAAGTPLEDLYASLAMGAQIPLGRVGRAAEFADLATFLLSPRSSYITGVGINLDGGLSPVT